MLPVIASAWLARMGEGSDTMLSNCRTTALPNCGKVYDPSIWGILR